MWPRWSPYADNRERCCRRVTGWERMFGRLHGNTLCVEEVVFCAWLDWPSEILPVSSQAAYRKSHLTILLWLSGFPFNSIKHSCVCEVIKHSCVCLYLGSSNTRVFTWGHQTHVCVSGVIKHVCVSGVIKHSCVGSSKTHVCLGSSNARVCPRSSNTSVCLGSMFLGACGGSCDMGWRELFWRDNRQY